MYSATTGQSIQHSMPASANNKLRKRKGGTKLKVAQVENSNIKSSDMFSSNFCPSARPRPKTPCLNSDIGN